VRAKIENPPNPDPSARRMVVLGCAGSGKTSLAQQIGEKTGLPVICLDEMSRRLCSQGDFSSFRSLLDEAHAKEAWISDGNFARVSFDIRLPRAELIIWLELPRIRCAWRACRRVFRQGEPHRLRDLPAVLAFIWRFDRVNRTLIEVARSTHGAEVPIIYLRSGREITAFLQSLGT
jgi:adenylate kinase family enzyme